MDEEIKMWERIKQKIDDIFEKYVSKTKKMAMRSVVDLPMEADQEISVKVGNLIVGVT